MEASCGTSFQLKILVLPQASTPILEIFTWSEKTIEAELAGNFLVKALLGKSAKLEPHYDGRLWELAEDHNADQGKKYFSAARLFRVAKNCGITEKIDQNLWNTITKGVELEPTTIVTDFDAFDYFSQKLNKIDNLQHIFYTKK